MSTFALHMRTMDGWVFAMQVDSYTWVSLDGAYICISASNIFGSNEATEEMVALMAVCCAMEIR